MTSSAMIFQSMLGQVGRLSRKETLSIVSSAHELYATNQRSNVVYLNDAAKKLTVCGDIHGQYSDLMHIFKLNGPPSKTNPYLFNGDFVDRGPNSLECISTLLLHKLIDPSSMFLNRGNHELEEMNSYYGFRDELKRDNELFQRFNDFFDLLPLAHVVNGKHFVVHGGVPRYENVSLADLEGGDYRFFSDLLWNDPSDKDGIHPSERGSACCRFGPDITRAFLEKNELKSLIRSHEVVANGVRVSQNGLCRTVFSASNYCGGTNLGGYIVINSSDGQLSQHTFSVPPRMRSKL